MGRRRRRRPPYNAIELLTWKWYLAGCDVNISDKDLKLVMGEYLNTQNQKQTNEVSKHG